ncbi:hypothetical protein N7592_20925 [Pseudomonas juntendi]|uniref:Imidazoleglycerol-phosphate synthase n=1 Tax=Pseudomonas juntendi TaxID=2666183 RepID=A0ABD4YA08_9PSED|nr:MULTISPECIES: hypothetical protein [Pseudomonas]MBH3375025.1 hypothetical protein [Pseudomonas juntendi]MBS6039923.1 hypothetical protein [Pseudomonas sp.]MDG9875623.1 hypothetical protein [Pseudomonas juntendi]MDH0756306.1 hypothetical protein [Pseudomonas juntendi]MDH1921899.1 hypothetical protein [Pseudomonas juntendi]
MNSKAPVRAQAVGIQSLEEFLRKMEEGAQTRKWDALLVFDRAATNALLTQEYIDRIDIKEGFFPELKDGVVDSGNGIKHFLNGLVLDKPRLSFENATIGYSKGKLQMRLVGGKHLEVIESLHNGQRFNSVTALIIYNAATRGILDMNIELSAVQGSVNDSGKVLLDLKEGEDHEFSGGATGPERIRLGVYFKGQLDSWSEEITQFPLSEMVVDANSPINPGVFGLRTHAAPGGALLGSENFGEGAVLVLVAMQGSETGEYPHDDSAMPYMLPAAVEPYTSNLILSNKFMASQIFQLGFEQNEITKGRFNVEALPGERFKLVANSGPTFSTTLEIFKTRSGGLGSEAWTNNMEVTDLYPEVFAEGSELIFEQRMLKGHLRSSGRVGYVNASWWSTWRPGQAFWEIYADLTIELAYKFNIAVVDGRAKLVFELDQYSSSVSYRVDIPADQGAKSWREMAKEIEAELPDLLKPRYQEQFDALQNIRFEIDALRLNNLLFRGENVVDPRDVSMPTDLTLLGNLAPKRTTMVISPSEPIVARGGVIEFSVSPASTGVNWTVSNLPGETGDTGSFKDPSVGRYTAPSDAALLKEGQRRLIVTATSGELVSKALVSVVPNHITVSPLVAVVGVGRSFAVSAGTPDGAAVTWDTPELGTVGPDDDPVNPGGYKYTAPLELPIGDGTKPGHYGELRLDEVTVRSVGGHSAKIDMLVVGSKSSNYWMEPEVRDDGKVALPFYKLNKYKEKVKVPEPIEWTVLRGGGSVDQDTQVYTPGNDGNDQYVIISAFHVNDDWFDSHDYVILPLPFVPGPAYTNILNGVKISHGLEEV